jgi:hypothetical protein
MRTKYTVSHLPLQAGNSEYVLLAVSDALVIVIILFFGSVGFSQHPLTENIQPPRPNEDQMRAASFAQATIDGNADSLLNTGQESSMEVVIAGGDERESGQHKPAGNETIPKSPSNNNAQENVRSIAPPPTAPDGWKPVRLPCSLCSLAHSMLARCTESKRVCS